MADQPPNFAENTIEAYKFKEYSRQAKGISFSAFLLSIFIYTSIFYIFNLSPSTLFNTTKFWFFISNTLILIIAADYGAFSSSKQNQDLDEEYVIRNRARSASSFVSQYPEVALKARIEACNKKKIEARSCGPSEPDHKDIRVVNDESNIILHRSETEKHEPISIEENEFSAMSDEELNRRVEEFIQKFNRQIRLQRTRNFRQN